MISSVIMDQITNRAKSKQDPQGIDFQEWIKVWFEAADELYDDFMKEGLTSSAAEVQRAVDFERKLRKILETF